MPTPLGNQEAHAITADVLQSGLCLFPNEVVVTLTFFFLHIDISIFKRPLSVISHGSSAWARSYRIDTTGEDGEEVSYFMKVNHFGNLKRNLFSHFMAVWSLIFLDLGLPW